jgi:hypothetical protein
MTRCSAHGDRIQLTPSRAVNLLGATRPLNQIVVGQAPYLRRCIGGALKHHLLDPLLSALKPLKSLTITDEPHGPPHPHHPW